MIWFLSHGLLPLLEGRHDISGYFVPPLRICGDFDCEAGGASLCWSDDSQAWFNMMRKVLIDDEGYIENPLVFKVPGLGNRKLWGGIAYRHGKKIKIGGFLPSEDDGKKINVLGISKGLYIAFGAVGCVERLICLVDEVADQDVDLRSVEASAVPGMYDIDSTMPLKIYLLEARQAMLVDKMNSLEKDIWTFKRALAAGIA